MYIMKNFITHTLSIALLALATLTDGKACNNSPDLCDRAYSNISQLGAHDSAFVRDASTKFSDSGNQYYNSTKQLDAGVRLLTVQVHKNGNEWHLCHSSCDLLDAGKLSTWLAAIKNWLDQNPNEVVTILIVNSDNAAASDLKSEYDTAQITQYAYTPASTGTALSSWPTLNELIAQKTRLINFVASLDPSQNTVAPFLLDEFTFVFETPFEVSDPSNFTCTPDRPSAVKGDIQTAVGSGRLRLMNHFLYSTAVLGIEEPDSANASRTNGPSGKGIGNLGDAAATCAQQWGQAPNFLLVDFFDQGPAIETVDRLNGITATGRKSLPAVPSSSSGSSGTYQGLSDLSSSAHSGSSPSVGNWIFVGGDWGKALGSIKF